MEKKGKRFFIVLIVSILSFLSLLFLFINITTINNINRLSSESYFQDINESIELESEKWRYKTEIEYMDNYCDLQSKLPSSSSQLVNVTVTRYDKRLPVSSVINPYPGYSSMYELGFVISADLEEISSKGNTMKLYRIELNHDSSSYIEYISDRDNPILYVVKDSSSDNFLLYPILNYVNTEYFINVD